MENNLPGNVRNKLLDRLEKVMALKDGATTQGELEASAERVLDLLDKLGLSEEQARKQLEARGEAGGKIEIVSDSVAWIGDQRTTWEMHLASAVAEGTNCECVWTPTHSVYVGSKVDAAAAAFLWGQLAYRLDEMSQEAMTQYARDYKKATGKSAYRSLGQAALKKYRRNWLSGAVQALRVRLVQRKQLADNETKALVVVKSERNKQAMVKMFPDLRFRRAMWLNSDDQARSDGYKAGSEMPIHKALEGNRRPGLLLGSDND